MFTHSPQQIIPPLPSVILKFALGLLKGLVGGKCLAGGGVREILKKIGTLFFFQQYKKNKKMHKFRENIYF